MVRAAQKGEMENPPPEISKVAATTSMSSVKKFAKTKHKGLPEKKVASEGVVDAIKKIKLNKTKVKKSPYSGRDAGAIAAKVMRQKQHNKYVNFLPVDEDVEYDDIEEGLRKRLAAAGAAAVLAGSGAGAAKAANYSGQVNVKYGSTHSQVSKKSISKGVDKAIKNFGTGKSGGSTVEKKGSRGLSGGINVSMSGGGSGESKTTKTKIKPNKTKDPQKTTNTNTSTNTRTTRTSNTNTSSRSNSNGSSKILQKGSYSMGEELNKDDKPFIKNLVKKLRGGSKTHAKQADDLEKAMKEESNPRIPRKKGQPANSKKHSDLYTDENPKGTIHGLGFKDVATAKASVSKIRNSSRSHAHKIQAAVAMEQRAREMGKTSEAAVYRKFINTMKKKTKSMNEGSLHKWFKGSKSKDGKGGWVNVVTGGTCASDEPGEGTPKCVSSSKRASMTKAERLSAARRKKKADPGQQSKTGAAKPTYVSTDSPRKKKMKEETQLNEVKDKKGKGSGSKDACYHKVKSRYSVWPSAYASGALVKCRKVGAANWGNSSKKEEFEPTGITLQQFTEKCWKGYEKKGMKTMFGKRYPNCVKKEQVEVLDERQKTNQGHRQSEEQHRSNYGKASVRNMRAFGKGGNAADPAERLVAMDARHKAHKEKRGVKTKGMKEEVKRDEYGDPMGGPKISKKQLKKNLTANAPDEQHTTTTSEAAAWTKKSGKNPSGGLNEKGRKSYERENPGSDLKRPSKKVGNKRRASFCARMKGMKKKLTSSKTANDPDSRINKSLRAWNC